MPAKVVSLWTKELAARENARDTRVEQRSKLQLREWIDRYEDAGHGSCLLRDPACAELVQRALIQADSQRYRLLEWCIMPNHVHVLIKPLHGTPLAEIIHGWKVNTARKINAWRGGSGPLWSTEHHDRLVRNPDLLASARSFIRRNPVAAGLCQSTDSWPWSSAYRG